MHEEVAYEKPFLKQVIARIDFAAPLEALQKSIPTALATAISDIFPIVEPTEAIAQEFQIGGAEMTECSKTKSTQWNFYGKDREKQLSIAPSFVFALYSSYMDYEDMKREFSAVIKAADETCAGARTGRFGLRYINNIEIEGIPPATGWNDYISGDLLATTAFSARSEHLTRLMHTVELKYGDLQIRFQFGLPNPDYPAVIKRPLFILDLDGYVQTAHDLRRSIAYMDEAHDHIQDLFENSITDRLRERMHVRPTAAI